MSNITFSSLGVDALVIDFGETMSVDLNRKILGYRQAIIDANIQGITEVVPTYTTLTIFYIPEKIDSHFPYEKLKSTLENISSIEQRVEHSQQVKEIPVYYEEPFAPDLSFVAETNGLSINEVIERHCKPLYHVYFLGFSPGFPFLGGLDEKIATPRRSSPRLKVPAGSVGIAGGQTGVYPTASPGGWQIIGRTPIQLFNVKNNPPSFLLPGDQVRFVPISAKEYKKWEGRTWQSK